jgi:hypothetical protein
MKNEKSLSAISNNFSRQAQTNASQTLLTTVLKNLINILLIKKIPTILTYTYSVEQSPSLVDNRIQLDRNFPVFNGIRRFMTALTSARHLYLS